MSLPTKQPTFIVAEIGSVHDGSLGNAIALAELAAELGADAAKFQTHIPEAETLRSARPPAHFTDESRYDYFSRTGFDKDQWAQLKHRCDEAGIEFMSSAFSVEALDLLETLEVARHKIASGEVTNLPLIRAVGLTGKPVLISSGMSNWAELDSAINALGPDRRDITVLQCTSLYPCPPERVGLNVLNEMRDRFGLAVGLSDHTEENYAAFAAVALGASVIEKHLTFSKRMYGSDAPFASEPAQFADLVKGIRTIDKATMAHADKDQLDELCGMKAVFEKSVVALVDIPEGSRIEEPMIGTKKPGDGISASRYDEVIGATATRTIAADSVLTEGDIAIEAPMTKPASP